ncbi:MAG: ribosome recycling factor [Fibrobacter sp.]|nr:ribosome recycling factor [Fibrobacter sp.]
MFSDIKDRMKKTVESTEREFAKIRAGQATPAILSDIMVDYYGVSTPISQVANITAPEPRVLLVSPWEKTMLEEIEKAILAANIGISPLRDGDLVRCPLPILTEERRLELTRVVRKHAEEGKIAIRNIRREANDSVRKDKEMSEDEIKKAQEYIQKITDTHIELIDKATQEKEQDLLQV